MSAPRLSLIVCTYNRASILPRCLIAATSQVFPKSDYEVVVVDNASSDHTRSIVREFSGVRYLYCGSRGLASARNTGVAGARAPLVAFIDDDAIAHPDLVRTLVETFENHPQAGCAGGRIDLCLPADLPGWYRPQFAGYYSYFHPECGAERRVESMAEFPFGANVAFRKEAILRAGYFNEKLGRKGKGQAGGEELDLEYRIFRMGYEVWVNPAAAVEHVVFPDRLRWPHISRSARAAGSNWAYYEIEFFRQPWSVRHDLRLLVSALARLPGRGFFPALADCNFYGSKIIRKSGYLLRGEEKPNKIERG